MRSLITVVAVAILAIFIFNGPNDVQANSSCMPQEMPQDYMKNDKLQRTKGAEHAEMAKRVGNWKVTTKYSPKFGGGTESGTCTIKLILGGKFVQADTKTTYMGSPSQTLGIYGYDTLAKEYTAYTVNDTYTASYEMRGKKRKDGIIEYKGVMKDAMSPQGRGYRVEEYNHGDDKFEFFVFDGEGKNEFKVLTLTYTRIK